MFMNELGVIVYKRSQFLGDGDAHGRVGHSGVCRATAPVIVFILCCACSCRFIIGLLLVLGIVRSNVPS